MSHLKRYSMPRSWPLPVKEKTWVVNPMPGPHRKMECMPLQVLLRDLLKYARDAREAKKILGSGKVLVDKKVRKEAKFPVGFMDIVEIPEIKKHFRVTIGRNGLALEKIGQEAADKKFCKVIGVRTVRGGITQVSLHDGRSLLVGERGKKADTKYKPGDTLVISLPEQKVLKHFKLEKGAKVIVTKGRNTGIVGTIKEIKNRSSMAEKSTVLIKTEKEEIETLKEYVMVGGEGA